MNRRKALKQMALLTGGALSASTVTGFMGGCSSKDKAKKFLPQTLSADQDELVIQLSECIIPATDTPGAKAANVNQYIDHMLTNWNTEKEKKYFLEGLNKVNKLTNKKFNKNFIELDTKNKVATLEKLEQEAIKNPQPIPNTTLKPFFSMIKEYTIVGYYTSQIGATQELKSNIIPGYYDGCVPYSEIGRAWS